MLLITLYQHSKSRQLYGICKRIVELIYRYRGISVISQMKRFYSPLLSSILSYSYPIPLLSYSSPLLSLSCPIPLSPLIYLSLCPSFIHPFSRSLPFSDFLMLYLIGNSALGARTDHRTYVAPSFSTIQPLLLSPSPSYFTILFSLSLPFFFLSLSIPSLWTYHRQSFTPKYDPPLLKIDRTHSALEFIMQRNKVSPSLM
jgi:hypothetical protein